ncbi:Dam family site-specific DNA-(adenine-N6)-methyltransferase [Desulfovibrio legallii]|uniref:Dam family site-specific DNA-(adenine-N6)-methyltransferase n=1 Tax=Desulfovibrio legallii TaxID=571438 RepID=UPI003A9519EA
MDMMTTKQAAVKWGISARRVTALCTENRIQGAVVVGKMWLIPKTAQKPEDGRSTRFEPPMDTPVKPFLKWVGGKAQVLNEIRQQYPAELGRRITKYAEPFVGGGAVLFDVISRHRIQHAYISDINKELITTYTAIRDHVDDVINELQRLESNYTAADNALQKEIYYKNRQRFNDIKLLKNSTIETSSLFIFLNKTCFNGLYRVNSPGNFNVPQGSYKNPKICDVKNLQKVSSLLQGIHIVCEDYKQSGTFIDKNTFAYFDPPYRPLTATANFTAYATSGFGDNELKELALFINEISARGAHIVASNSDPKNADVKDNFFDNLYAKHKIIRIGANRAINSVGGSRGKISELLICNT